MRCELEMMRKRLDSLLADQDLSADRDGLRRGPVEQDLRDRA